MKDVVVVGSINMDLTIDVPNFPAAGETILGNSINYYFGGKGANQSVTIGKLGGNVAMLGKVGDDSFGDKLINNLMNNGVDVSRVEVEENCSSGMAYICVNKSGENNIVVCPEANNKVDKNYIDRNIDIIKKSRFCISQMEIPLETIEYLADICAKEGVKFILNPAPMRDLNREIYSKVSILILNETELEHILGYSIDINDIKSYENDIKNIGSENIIITLGKEGSFLVNSNGNQKFESIKVKAIDTTGAGDSFVGALGFKLSKGNSIEESIKFATIVSGIAVTKKGAQDAIPTIEEINCVNW